jgi:hypothetical protein
MRSAKLVGQVVLTAELDDADQIRMYELMNRHYDNVHWEAFRADLAEKQWVILLKDKLAGVLYGFSTQMSFPVEVAGRQILAVYSGDTIVDREQWGTTALGLAAVRLAFSLIDEHPEHELFWFLISKGYKTYRFLPVYFREFFPRYDRDTPAWAADIIAACGRKKFPETYDPATGLVMAAPDGCRLREGVAAVSDQRLGDPHVQYFLQRNPDHAEGNELCCIAALTRENFSPTARRWVESKAFTHTGAR